ncbi:MAG: mechanosensitive ion channel [Maribacter sp.]|nr:mechanosensitive ion channel family protein [Maribacter sp.]NNK75913.1 mechanosensitive ion channel [Maribacter sp.]
MNEIIEFFQTPTGVKLITVFVSVLIVFILTGIIKRVIPKYVSQTGSRYRARKFINFMGYALVILAIIIVYSNQLTGFTVFLGVAGAGIAFALQEVIASVAGFIAINFTSFFKVGDRVLLGGIKGDVIDIGVLRTSLMEIGDWVNGDLYNGRIVLVANSFIFKEPVFNYSGDFPFLWDELKVPIKTEGDFEYAQEKFLEILNEVQGKYAEEAKKHWEKMTEKLMIEKARVEPMVQMVFDENWITFTLRYVVDFKSRRSTKDLISTKVLKAIRASEGKIQVASAAFEITAFPK